MSPEESCERSYLREKSLVRDCKTLAYRKGKNKNPLSLPK